ELVTFGEHLVEIVLAQHRAQGGLGQLAGGLDKVFDLDDRTLRVDDAKIDDRIHFHRNIVVRNHVLRRDVEHDRPQVRAHHLLDDRNEDDQSRAFHAGETAQSEDDPSLIFAKNLYGRPKKDEYEQRQG